jgi:hypothetical protein
LHERLGALYLDRATRFPEAPGSAGDLRAALQNYRAAVAQRPMSPYPWAAIAHLLHIMNGDPLSMWFAFDRAVEYGRNEAAITTVLAEIGYAHHDELSAPRRAWLKQSFADANGARRESLLALARRNKVDPAAL